MPQSEMVIRRATRSDTHPLRCFLDAVALPSSDVDPESQAFLVACVGPAIVGTIALELRPPNALIRSLAVAPDYRGHGLGARLHDRVFALARELELEALYLLTTSAQHYARSFGFAVIPRSEVPPEIAALAQFRALCPASAICMGRRLSEQA